MREHKQTPEQFTIVSHKEGARREHDVEITEKERTFFQALDALGEAGQRILQKFYKHLVPESFETDRLTIDFDFSINDEELAGLSETQRAFIQTVTEQLKMDHKNLSKRFETLSPAEQVKEIEDAIFANTETQSFDLKNVRIAVVPGGVGILIQNHEYFLHMFPDAERVDGKGFFQRHTTGNAETSAFNGRVFVVDATRPTAQATFKHEYLHLLTENYFEPNEIAPLFPKELEPIETEIAQLQEQIAELDEEMEFTEHDDVLAMQQRKELRKQKIVRLQPKRKELVDQSSIFLTQEAERFFMDVRNELAAHAVSGNINFNEETLIPNNSSWQERMDQITHQPDKQKFAEQWLKLKSLLTFCSQKNVPPEQLLPILLTSQNFDQMTKRLLLFIEKDRNVSDKKQAA